MTVKAPPPPDATDPRPPGPVARWRMTLDRAARGRWALPALFLGSFIDSTVLPWPVAFPLAAQMLRGRRFVFPAAFAVLAGSVLGCAVMFALGLLAYEAVAPLLLDDAGVAATVEGARANMEARGAWAVFVGMMTPVPVQLTSFSAALAGVGPVWFALAMVAGRSIRYLSMAVVLFFFGETIVAWWRRLSRPVRWGMIGLFAGIFAVLTVMAFI